MSDETSVILAELGLNETRVAETKKNAALTRSLVAVHAAAKRANGNQPISAQHGGLLYLLTSKAKKQVESQLNLVIPHILDGGIRTETQVTAALEYLLGIVASGTFDETAFRTAAGIGIVVTVDEIEAAVTACIEKYKNELLRERYAFNVGKILGDVRAQLKWADGAYVKQEVELRRLELLGVRTAEDDAPKKKVKEPAAAATKPAKETTTAVKQESANAPEETCNSIEELMKRTSLHKPGENFKTDGYVVTPRTSELLKKHLQETGGKVITRFPPEPNGILHIGHAKAINIDFGYAKAFGGECNLRFDDTNPEKEEEKFFTAIEDLVRWLGYEPARITHSSDYFDQLYDLAVELIRRDLAYVCHQTVEEMRGFDVKPSPWRTRPIEESLRLFEDMKNGKFEEGAATLRMKHQLEEGKLDPVAYRIKYVRHHRTGDKWCIYPSYDYTHCLCDSMENITHSLCTKEFQSRRSSYYWLCNALDVYCPVQWEYSRLSMSYTLTSKRKIAKLITEGIVRDWDDPRLFTLTALRRRGIPPEAINSFVAQLGMTVSEMTLEPHALDQAVRDYLNTTAPRTMVVLEPLRIRIANWAALGLKNRVAVPDFPGFDDKTSTHEVTINDVVYIEQNDWRADDAEKGFRRLTKTQSVGLKHAGLVLSYVDQEQDPSDGRPTVVVKAAVADAQNKPKAFIHWVSDPLRVEARLYERLFLHKNPGDETAVPGGFLSDCNPNSLKVLDGALADRSLASVRPYDRFQFERIGFFSVDTDSTKDKIVFNRTVLLKEDAAKN